SGRRLFAPDERRRQLTNSLLDPYSLTQEVTLTRSLRLGPHMHRLVAVTLVFALAGCASPGTAQAPQSTDTASVEVPAPPSQLSRTHTITPQFYAAHPTYVQALPNDLRQLWSDTGVPEEALSLVVAEINHAPLFAINPVTPRNPA